MYKCQVYRVTKGVVRDEKGIPFTETDDYTLIAEISGPGDVVAAAMETLATRLQELEAHGAN